MPVEVVEFSLREPEAAQAVLTELYRPERPLAFSGVRGSFSCELRSATAGDLGADRLRFTTGMRSSVPPLDDFLVVSPVGGAVRYAAGREQVDTRPGEVARHPNDVTIRAEWDDLDLRVVRLPLAVIERVAEERLGVVGADLRFDGMSPVSEPMRRTWLGLVRFVHQQLADPGTAVTEPLVQAPLAELVAATALAAFPNTTMTSGYQPDPGPVAPAVVRRAVAFIDAHASLPISVSDVARAAGVRPAGAAAGLPEAPGMQPDGLRAAGAAGVRAPRAAGRRPHDRGHGGGDRGALGVRQARPVHRHLPRRLRRAPQPHPAHLSTTGTA
jgi:hypothetical protein